MINRLVISLLGVLAVCLALGATWLLGSSTGYQLGFAEGQAKSQSSCHSAQLQELHAVLATTASLTAAANTASQALGQTISARQQADAKTTREIRNALNSTASQRAGCLFDADSMRQLDAARERAATAASGGIGGPVPSPR